MSSTATQIEQLRTTARHLYSVASLIGRSRAITVYTLAGPDTWVGPTGQACSEALLAVRQRLVANQQTINDTARRLERRADVLGQQPVVSSAF